MSSNKNRRRKIEERRREARRKAADLRRSAHAAFDEARAVLDARHPAPPGLYGYTYYPNEAREMEFMKRQGEFFLAEYPEGVPGSLDRPCIAFISTHPHCVCPAHWPGQRE